MVIIDTVINALLGRVTRHPASMHCPSRDDAFVSSYYLHCNEVRSCIAAYARHNILPVLHCLRGDAFVSIYQ